MINIAECKKLYKEGFPDDTDAFIDMFFKAYIKEKNIINYFENGSLISAGYIIEKQANIFSQDIKLPFLTALSTKAEHRGKNKLSNVMTQAFNMMYKRRYPFFMLHPFNYNYYKKFGLNNISFAERKKVSGGIKFDSFIAKKTDAKVMLEIYNNMAGKFDNYISLDIASMENKILEYYVDNINIEVLILNGKAFAYAAKEQGDLEFYAYTDEKLFNNADNFKGLNYFDFTSPKTPFLQGRIINVEKAIELCRFDKNLNKNVRLGIIDEQIKENNIILSVDISGGSAKIRKCSKADIIMDISLLTSYLFCGAEGYLKPQINFFPDKF